MSVEIARVRKRSERRPRDTVAVKAFFRGTVPVDAITLTEWLHRFRRRLVPPQGFDIAYVDVIDRPRQSGLSNYGFFDRLWIVTLDLAGPVWWLIRRKIRRPQPLRFTAAIHTARRLAITVYASSSASSISGWRRPDAQLLDTARFLVQWISSDAPDQSVVPMAFLVLRPWAAADERWSTQSPARTRDQPGPAMATVILHPKHHADREENRARHPTLDR